MEEGERGKGCLHQPAVLSQSEQKPAGSYSGKESQDFLVVMRVVVRDMIVQEKHAVEIVGTARLPVLAVMVKTSPTVVIHCEKTVG